MLSTATPNMRIASGRPHLYICLQMILTPARSISLQTASFSAGSRINQSVTHLTLIKQDRTSDLISVASTKCLRLTVTDNQSQLSPLFPIENTSLVKTIYGPNNGLGPRCYRHLTQRKPTLSPTCVQNAIALDKNDGDQDAKVPVH